MSQKFKAVVIDNQNEKFTREMARLLEIFLSFQALIFQALLLRVKTINLKKTIK